jgi:hypothetical protein
VVWCHGLQDSRGRGAGRRAGPGLTDSSRCSKVGRARGAWGQACCGESGLSVRELQYREMWLYWWLTAGAAAAVAALPHLGMSFTCTCSGSGSEFSDLEMEDITAVKMRARTPPWQKVEESQWWVDSGGVGGAPRPQL